MHGEGNGCSVFRPFNTLVSDFTNFLSEKVKKTKQNISLGMFPMKLHQQGFWSSSSFLTGHRNLGITQDPRVLQAAQPISTRSCGSDALCWTAGVHTNRTRTAKKKRILFPTRGRGLSCGSVFVWKVFGHFSSGNNIISKEIL